MNDADFLNMLTYCDQPTLDRIITDLSHKDSFLAASEISGHFVLENAAVFYTSDMEATMKWFEKTLGWEDTINARDESGQGV